MVVELAVNFNLHSQSLPEKSDVFKTFVIVWQVCMWFTEGLCMHTAWCSEIGSLTSLNACNSCSCNDVTEPISLHQAVCTVFVCLRVHACLEREREREIGRGRE